MLVADQNETYTIWGPARPGAMQSTAGHPAVILARAMYERHTAVVLATALLLLTVAVAGVWTVADSGSVLGFAWWFKVPSHFFHFHWGSSGRIA